MSSKATIGSNIRNRLIKSHVIKSDSVDCDDPEAPCPKEEANNHVNWANELEKIQNLTESKKTEATASSHKANSHKSILKSKSGDPSDFLEHDSSSSTSDDSDDSLSRASKLPCLGLNHKKNLEDYSYTNKKFLKKILNSEDRHLFNLLSP